MLILGLSPCIASDDGGHHLAVRGSAVVPCTWVLVFMSLSSGLLVSTYKSIGDSGSAGVSPPSIDWEVQ